MKALRFKEAYSRRFEQSGENRQERWHDVDPEVSALRSLEARAIRERAEVEWHDGNRADQRRAERDALNASLEGFDWVCL